MARIACGASAIQSIIMRRPARTCGPRRSSGGANEGFAKDKSSGSSPEPEQTFHVMLSEKSGAASADEPKIHLTSAKGFGQRTHPIISHHRPLIVCEGLSDNGGCPTCQPAYSPVERSP